ncbi:hypothetical protein BRC83_00110 [Halobacteriales archaeon QS_1_68_17]|nr:MAG: hypothetical protein BRC83_00110 [Halobacteriales archaeon QS_1_68_17]
MDDLRLAPSVGIVGCLAVLATLAAPYVLAADSAAVGTYYGTGAVNPLVDGLFALVLLIVFAAGREGRTDPGYAAGMGLVFGLFMIGVALAWALTVRVDAVLVSESHRWVLVAVAALPAVASAWYVRALGLV